MAERLHVILNVGGMLKLKLCRTDFRVVLQFQLNFQSLMSVKLFKCYIQEKYFYGGSKMLVEV